MSWVGAPDELTWWQEKARQNVAKQPTISLPGFGDSVRNWWLELQPEWRGPALSRDTPADHLWFGFKVGGPGGLFLVVMCMSWWLPFVTADDINDFTSLANDITWVLHQSDSPPSKATAGGRRGRASAASKPIEDVVGPTKRKAATPLKQPAKKVAKRSGGRR